MILELPRRTEYLGAVRFHDVQKVYELDSGSRKFPTKAKEAVATLSTRDIERIEQKMAIVISAKDERLKLLEGVLSGIPHDCHIILVSNSRRSPADRFRMEKQTIQRFNHFVEDKILLIHQQDSGLSEAFRSVGFDSILDERGVVRSGKAEGMFTGILLAKMLGKKYVGFVDADNYMPGSVHEDVEIYAAALTLAESPYSMVRVSWVYKPKVVMDKLLFPRVGRVSEVSSQFINRLIAGYTGFGTEIIKTANSGEHAMSMELAELLCYGSGFAVEPYELVNLLEQFGGILPPIFPQVMAPEVDVFQVETRNPHLHENKGDEHIGKMLFESLGAIYHSSICTNEVKDGITAFFAEREEKVPPPPIRIKPPIEVDLRHFIEVLKQKSKTLTKFG